MKRRFEYKVGWSSKFWEIELVDCAGVWAVTTHYGKTHTKGNTTSKKFARNKKAAETFIKNKVREKLQKGYIETAAPTVSINPLLQSIEQLTVKGTAPKTSRATKEEIKNLLADVADEVKNSLPAGVPSEVIVTVIIGNEVIQESLK